jgi:transcriptional regulator with XRE-family HTH domain
MNIGQTIQLHREKAGLTRKGLSERTGLEHKTIRKAETNDGITLNSLGTICGALGLEITLTEKHHGS